jgi:hypothetical protein
VILTKQVHVVAARCHAIGVTNTDEFGHKHSEFGGTVLSIGVFKVLKL